MAESLGASRDHGGDPALILRAAQRGAATSARNREDAEDAAQEAAIQVWRDKDRYNNPQRVAYVAGKRRAIDRMRRLNREGEAVCSWTELKDVSTPPEPTVEDATIQRLYALGLLHTAQQLCTDQEYMALEALVTSGGTMAEAARFLALETGRSEDSIRKQIGRAAVKIRRTARVYDD